MAKQQKKKFEEDNEIESLPTFDFFAADAFGDDDADDDDDDEQMMGFEESLQEMYQDIEKVKSEIAIRNQEAENEYNRRKDDREDSEYWLCVVFQNREQAAEFARKSKLLPDDDHYMDGMVLAERLGITLETPIMPMPTNRSVGEEMLRMAKEYWEYHKDD